MTNITNDKRRQLRDFAEREVTIAIEATTIAFRTATERTQQKAIELFGEDAADAAMDELLGDDDEAEPSPEHKPEPNQPNQG